jgi:hypothetical protein
MRRLEVREVGGWKRVIDVLGPIQTLNVSWRAFFLEGRKEHEPLVKARRAIGVA